ARRSRRTRPDPARRAGDPGPEPALRRRAAQRGALERALLQGPRKFSRRDLEQQQDIPQRMTAVYWRSLGFAPVDEDTVVFTEEDAYAIGDLSAIVEDGALSER